MNIVSPTFDHQISIASALNRLSEHFFEIGMKLKSNGSPEQLKKYKEITNAYAVVRGAVAQNFIFEESVNSHEYNVRIYQEEINRLKKELEAAQKAFNELDNF